MKYVFSSSPGGNRVNYSSSIKLDKWKRGYIKFVGINESGFGIVDRDGRDIFFDRENGTEIAKWDDAYKNGLNEKYGYPLDELDEIQKVLLRGLTTIDAGRSLTIDLNTINEQ